MSRTHTSAIAGQTVTLGQGDRGMGNFSRSNKPRQSLLSPNEISTFFSSVLSTWSWASKELTVPAIWT